MLTPLDVTFIVNSQYADPCDMASSSLHTKLLTKL